MAETNEAEANYTVRQRVSWWWRDRRYWTARRLDMWALAAAHRLPRRIAMWAFVRVATEDCADNPLDQTLQEVMDRWEANS